MNPIKQEDKLGCAVACTAFILELTYKDTLKLFIDGEKRAKEIPNFYCPEIVKILNIRGLKYKWKRIKNLPINFPNLSIVFIQKSVNLPFGHFLVRNENSWMDPWINLPNPKIQSGFREKLPGIPTYLIYPI
jgi:hypothetical protein